MVKITTKQQFEMLIETMEANPNLARGVRLSQDTTYEVWNGIAENLNSHGPPTRTPNEWQRVWIHFKAKLKKKMERNKRNIEGGRPSQELPISALEQAVVELLEIDLDVNTKKTVQIRISPSKKWSRSEEICLIAFLKRNIADFEEPTAQRFYTKFIDETHIPDIDWKLVRNKVINMKMCYNRAKQWQESSEASALNDGENLQDIVTKMCYFSEDFKELCKAEPSFNFNGSEDAVKEEPLSDDCETSCSMEDERIPDDVTHSSRLRKRKLETDVPLRAEELQIEREKLDFQIEKLKQEMDMRQKEIDSQERLKILEIEMKERIAMNEIKMKERVALKALEKKWY